MTIVPLPPVLWDTARTVGDDFRVRLDVETPITVSIERAILDDRLAPTTDDLVALAFDNRDIVGRALANAWRRHIANAEGGVASGAEPRMVVVIDSDFR